MKKQSAARIALMAFGILVAVAILCGQMFYINAETSKSKKEVSEQTQSENNENPDTGLSFSVPSTTLPSTAHIDFNPHVFVLFEIAFKESKPEATEFNPALPLSQCFRTLFGLA